MAFRDGDRVKHVGHSFMTGVPDGALGTVSKVAGFGGGKSIYCDPARKMVFVTWDSCLPKGVFIREIEKVSA